MIQRQIEKKIKAALKKYPVITLTGPRQSGKTTLLKTIFPNYQYITLENPKMRAFAEEDAEAFLAQYNDKLIIDEAQNVPKLFSYIQGIVDEEKKNGRFILSGSQNFLLLESVTQSLAGRVAIFELLPLSITELSESKKLPDLNELLIEGSYPRLYDETLKAHEWIPDYIKTYLERDVRQMKNITDLRQFKKFLKVCATRNGQLLNLSSIGNETGVSHSTIREWISILEASYIIFLLKPYTKQITKRESKSPKLYFYDTGLVSSLLGITTKEDLLTSPHKGHLFESLIISEYLKHHYNNRLPFDPYFWRHRDHHEIDLIIENKNSLSVIEMKSSTTMSSDFFKNLNYFKAQVKTEIINAYVIYAGKEKIKRTAATLIPWHTPLITPQPSPQPKPPL